MTFDLITDLFFKVASVVVPALLGWLWANIKDLKKSREAERQGLMALLHDRILQGYNYHEAKGYYDFDSRKALDVLYNAYHALGGNGLVDEAMSRLRDLPYGLPEVEDD